MWHYQHGAISANRSHRKFNPALRSILEFFIINNCILYFEAWTKQCDQLLTNAIENRYLPQVTW